MDSGLVIDTHCHVGRWGTFGVDDHVDRFIATMDATGIDVACINCILHGEAARANDVVAAYVSRRPDRFVGVACVTPFYPSEALRELDRAFGKLGLRFLFVPEPDFFQHPVDSPSYAPILQWADERGLLVMCNLPTPVDGPATQAERYIDVARRYPRVRWVIAHAGNGAPGQEDAIRAARACPNVYLETSTSLGDHETIELLVEGAGEDRVLFGSDMLLLEAGAQIGRVATADISEVAKRKVLGLNAAQLLGPNPSLP